MPILTHEERIGTLLAEKYRLESILGRGGMGAVFGARHEWTGRRVAVKLLNYEYASHDEMAERFLREARAAGTLDHPNVVDVLDMGKDAEGTVYLVLELLEGQTLSSVLYEKGRLEAARAYELLMPVMRALAYAHKRGVVHRDLKPDNIFISDDPEHGLVPKLLDFGIAKVLDSEQPISTTRAGTIIGTAEYMSPEQARGTADIGAGTDVWSMGVVWYEALTGVVPFEGSNATAVILAIVDGKHDRLEQKLPKLAKPIAAAIERALLVDRAERYPDMNAFIEAMDAARRGLSVLPPPLENPASLPVLPRTETAMTQPSIEVEATTEPSSRIELAVSVPPPAVQATPTEMTAKLVALDADGAPIVARSSTELHWSQSSSAPGRGRAMAVAALGALIVLGGVGFAVLGTHHGTTPSPEPVAHVASRAATVVPPAPVAAPAVVPPAPAPVVVAPTPPAVVAPAVPVAPALAPVAVEPPAVTRPGHHDAHHPSRAAHAVVASPQTAPATAAPVAVAVAPTAPTPPAAPPPTAPPAAHPHPASSHNANAPLTDYELGP